MIIKNKTIANRKEPKTRSSRASFTFVKIFYETPFAIQVRKEENHCVASGFDGA